MEKYLKDFQNLSPTKPNTWLSHMSRIILATLNARYIHASLGLRYLMANMGDLKNQTELKEFNCDARPIDIAETLLSGKPDIIGFGVYIWNVEQTTALIKLIKTISPETTIVIGGPEVSYEYEDSELLSLVDYLIIHQADQAFATLCQSILEQPSLPLPKVIHPKQPDILNLALPYPYYTDEDIANRVIYVEASRGCPFKCEFCLSALDKTAMPFNLDDFLQAMETLYQRGARHFKFVDRTFNLNIKNSSRILMFFIEKLQQDHLFLHFEMIPDHLPDALKTLIKQFPAGTLQFEIGIQSLNPFVQQLISRKQHPEKTQDNLLWLHQQTSAHVHADLIAGLPGENLSSFAKGFNTLIDLQPDEIQVGILKRLKGTPIIRHTIDYDMRFSPIPPYNLLSNSEISFDEMQRIQRFARYWDLIANSGRFTHTLPFILADSAFENFMTLSNWLFEETAQTHRISLERLFRLIFVGLTTELSISPGQAEMALLNDFQKSGIKGRAKFMSQPSIEVKPHNPRQLGARQQQHLQ